MPLVVEATLLKCTPLHHLERTLRHPLGCPDACEDVVALAAGHLMPLHAQESRLLRVGRRLIIHVNDVCLHVRGFAFHGGLAHVEGTLSQRAAFHGAVQSRSLQGKRLLLQPLLKLGLIGAEESPHLSLARSGNQLRHQG